MNGEPPFHSPLQIILCCTTCKVCIGLLIYVLSQQLEAPLQDAANDNKAKNNFLQINNNHWIDPTCNVL